MKITVKQAVELYNAISNLKQGGVYLKGLKNIDLAMNKKSVECIFEGYKNAMEVPEEYKKYVDEIEKLKLKMADKNGAIKDPQDASEKFQELQDKYSKAIEDYENWKKDTKNLVDEEKDVSLIMINKSDINFTDENNSLTPEIIFGLLPIIKDVENKE